jgi:hypothetical protein
MAEDQARMARLRRTLVEPLPAQTHGAAEPPAAFGAATRLAAEGLA